MQKLKQTEYSDHYSVFDKNGKKVCDSSSIEDTLMMVSMGQQRTYKQVKILLDQIVNISSQRMEDDKQLEPQNILPDRQQEPFVV